jgi:hypothetical protein
MREESWVIDEESLGEWIEQELDGDGRVGRGKKGGLDCSSCDFMSNLPKHFYDLIT